MKEQTRTAPAATPAPEKIRLIFISSRRRRNSARLRWRVICGVKSEQKLDRSIASFWFIDCATCPAEIPHYGTHRFSRSRAFYPGLLVLNCGHMSSAPKKSEPSQSFEGAMDRLEEIVEQMESGKM